VFDVHKLRWMGGEHVRAADPARLVHLCEPFLRAAGLEPEVPRAAAWMAAFRDGLAHLSELPPRVHEILEPGAPEPDAAAALQTPGSRLLLPLVAARVENAAATPGGCNGTLFKTLVQAGGKELGLKGRDLFMPVRAALSGRTHGPELPLLFDALGSARAAARLRAAAA
jgi:nondiscriminating glutamyl-tRNA synthetase